MLFRLLIERGQVMNTKILDEKFVLCFLFGSVYKCACFLGLGFFYLK